VAWCATVAFHHITGTEPSYPFVAFALFAWTLLGHLGAFLAYRKLIYPAYGKANFIDAIALEAPARARPLAARGDASSRSENADVPPSGPGGMAG
jgi:hypothetical protein